MRESGNVSRFHTPSIPQGLFDFNYFSAGNRKINVSHNLGVTILCSFESVFLIPVGRGSDPPLQWAFFPIPYK